MRELRHTALFIALPRGFDKDVELNIKRAGFTILRAVLSIRLPIGIMLKFTGNFRCDWISWERIRVGWLTISGSGITVLTR